jgi:REP element-mobilizing transposase RayT
MPQPLRIQSDEVLYHLTTRGVDRRAIFLDDDDRRFFLRLLDRVVRLDGFVIHAYCLMTNHVHLLVETPRANLAHGIQRLLAHYAREHNARAGRRGHLFERRYLDRLVETEEHLISTARYLARNPVEAGLCPNPADWRWSSHRATAGLAPRPRFLTTTRILAAFDHRRPVARALYRTLCDEPDAPTGKIAA